jgi:two-component system, LytTR family, sensor kinase
MLQRRYTPIILHIVAWGLIVPFFMLQPLFWEITLPIEFWEKQGILYIVLITMFYTNAHYLTPQLLFKGKSWKYLTAILCLIVAIYMSMQIVDNWLDLPHLWYKATHPNNPNHCPPPRKFWRLDTFLLLYSTLALGISTSITVIEKWQKDARIRQALEQEKINTELSLLKAQINPHFFFNTLNNIYALTIIDGDIAREAIHRLSRMMRYVLYENQEGFVRLSQEVAFIQDYIQLMQLRLTDRVKIDVTVPSQLNDVLIAQMLLLPFVENAFKHGVSATQPSHIRVSIKQDSQTLIAIVENTLFTSNKSISLESSNGIGLVNTRRRLDLLYGNNYQLEVSKDDENQLFKVSLRLITT